MMSIDLENKLNELESLSAKISDLIYENKFAEILSLDKKRQSIILGINKLHAKAYEKRLRDILSENLKNTTILDQKFINYKKKNNKILDKMAAYSKN